MNNFDSIRPFGDDEIKDILISLSNNEIIFKLFLKSSNLGVFANLPFGKWFLKKRISKLALSINTVEDPQNYFKKLVQKVINDTIDNFTHSGMEHLDPKKNYLFISNHRDITLDATLLNFLLNSHGHKTSNNAVGNNLMSHEWAAHLMRLNKSFVIQRDGSSKKDIYAGLNLASEFINHCLENNESVWIAQRQGRAKDGIDVSDPAILKMIQLARRKSKSTAEFFNEMRLVPVSISYEFDPNDILKAKELTVLAEEGNYLKHANEDLDSIVRGINEFKGNVHIAINPPMSFQEGDEHKEIADKITETILKNYKLQPSNIVAHSLLENKQVTHNFGAEQIRKAKDYFQKRLKGLTPKEEKNLLMQYANPVISKRT